MEKIMAILTEEADYGRELAAYLSSKEEFEFKPVVFTDAEMYIRYEKDNRVDLLLSDNEELTGSGILSAGEICFLSEYSRVSESDSDRKAIFKYQSSEAIMKEIMENYGITAGAMKGKEAIPAKRHTPRGTGIITADNTAVREALSPLPYSEPVSGARTICVCSPLGGSRCSTYALGLAEYFAKKGETLFLSFDPFYRIAGMPEREDRGTLTELIYCLETGTEDEKELLAGYVRRFGGADCLYGFSSWLDPQDITEEQSLKLMKCIKSEAVYRNIVIDMGRPSGAFLEFMALCGDIYVPRRKGKRDDRAIEDWKKQLVCAGFGDIAERLRERTIPNDRGLEGDYPFEKLLLGSLGGYIRETEEFGYFG